MERGNQQISILSTIARLKLGVTREQAQAELETILSRTKSVKGPLSDGQVRLASLHAKLVGDTRRLLLILLGAVSLILLIACANVANLLLSRAAVRQKEFAIRASLGAHRLRLMRQMLTESLLLALGGGVLGLLLAFGLTKALVVLAAAETFGDISRLATINIDLRVLGFTLLVSCVTGMLFGLVPAIQLSRPNLNDSLKEGGRSGGFHRSRLRQLLMVTEVALAMCCWWRGPADQELRQAARSQSGLSASEFVDDARLAAGSALRRAPPARRVLSGNLAARRDLARS